MADNLIIFIKNPVIGEVKTRLAKTIGDNLALSVYKDLMEKCKKECVNVNVNRFVFYSKAIEEDIWTKTSFKKHLQSQGDLGEKIKSAFQTIQKGKQKTIIIGSDCYDLDSQTIKYAFEQLDFYDLVIGPANDGGYYLIGSNLFYPSLFDNITWSSEKVFKQTINQAKKLNLNYYILKELVDIDNIEDIHLSSYSRVFKNYD